MSVYCDDIQKESIKKKLSIMDKYFDATDEILPQQRRQTFFDLKYLLLIEVVSGQNLDDFVKIPAFSSVFSKYYSAIKERISMNIKELSNKSIAEYKVDQFTEIVVILFRVLNYLDFDDQDRLILRGEGCIRMFNDIQSNILVLEFIPPGVSKYADYKRSIEKIEELKHEFEYINYFSMNYLNDRTRGAFKVTQIYFDDSSVHKNFIEGEVSFRSSVKIIEELIGPLYLNKEKYGLREVLQNAIDACVKKKKVSTLSDDYIPCVKIKYIRNPKPGLLIEDNGVGMNENTIINHFLTIGESSKNGENDGDGYVGRFGIGILSAFMLTDNLNFETLSPESIEPQAKKYKYSSEPIEFDNLKKEKAPIHIEKTEVAQTSQTGTSILLNIKEDILNKIDQTLIGKIKTLQDLYKKTFDKKDHYSEFGRYKNNLWKSENERIKAIDQLFEKLELEAALTSVSDLPSFFEKAEDILEQVIANLNNLKYLVIDKPNQTQDESIKYKNELTSLLEKLTASMKELKFLDAISCFNFLEANRWYLNDEVKICFYCDNQSIELYNNVIEVDYKEIQNGKDQININYTWLEDNDLQGKVLCNHIQIPTKYEFKHYLSSAFKEFPLFSVIEKGGDRLKIDLSRERCELNQYEDLMLFTILSDVLQETLTQYNVVGTKEFILSSNYVHDVPLIYYKHNGKVHFSLKSSAIIKQLVKEGFRAYRILSVEANIFSPPDDFEKYMSENVIYEFANLDYIHPYSSDVNKNPLRICARNNMGLYLSGQGKESISDVLPIDSHSSKALLLASNNFKGVLVNAMVENQLKLNNDYLRGYQDSSRFLEALEQNKEKMLVNNVICLDYYRGDRTHDYLKSIKTAGSLLNTENMGIKMILEFYLDNYDYSTDLLVDVFKKLSSQLLHNKLQVAFSQIPESQADRLKLLERYEYVK